MFVLGVDPGLTRCGYGALERRASKDSPFRAVLAGVIETPPTSPVDQRLGQLVVEIEGLLDELRPSVVVVERTAISVAQASGVVLAAAARRDIEVAQYTPNEVKQGVVGSGGASKAQVQAMVARLCGLSEPPRPPDVADALALAACHLSSDRFRAAVKAASA